MFNYPLTLPWLGGGGWGGASRPAASKVLM